MNYCTNQGHDDLSGNWDDPRRILWPLFWSLSPSPLLTFVSWHTHSLFYSLFSLFFLLIPSSSSSLPFSLSTFQLFLLEISPQAENLVIVVESDTGGSHGIREASHTISLLLYTDLAGIGPRGAQRRTRQKHQLMDIIKSEEKKKSGHFSPLTVPGQEMFIFLFWCTRFWSHKKS